MKKSLADHKIIWANHCKKCFVPLYFHPWWMDSVCEQKDWDVCLSLNKDGDVEGALVYHTSKYFGLTVIKPPPLTAYSGLWFHYPMGIKRSSSKMMFEKRVCQTLFDQLPKHSFIYQQWHPEITNWLPLFWKDYKQTTHYTYYLEILDDKSKIFEKMKGSARTDIKNAQKIIDVTKSDQLDLFFSMYSLSLQRQNKKPQFSFENFIQLDKELKERNSRAILVAQDKLGNVHGAIYLVWDEKYTYFLLSGVDPNFKSSNAMYLLLWKALEWNIGNTKCFDFEGAMLEPVERFFRAFGGKLTPHFKIYKAQNKLFQLASVLLSKEYY